MLKVLIFSPLALEYGRGGEISCIELSAGLNKFYKITLLETNILPGNKLLTYSVIKNKLKGVKRNNKIRYYSLKLLDKIFTFPYPQDIIKLLKMIHKNDIIYFSESTIKNNLLFVFSSLLHRRGKFIVGYRKPFHINKRFSLYNFKNRMTILIFLIFKKRLYHHTISKHAKYFLHNFYSSERITHITHGVVLDDYINNNMNVKNKNNLSFIYVGNIDKPHKGVDILISGIDLFLTEHKKLDVLFEFCGTGPLESDLKMLEEKYPNHIKYHGYVSNEKIAEYYKRNDVFLFSSRKEPFGRVILEALASELVVICSKTIGSIEILTNKDFAFFIKDFRPQAIEEKINEIYNLWVRDSKWLVELQKSAKDYVFQYYNFSIELELFQKLISRVSNER